jgi:hypothetical protein
MSAEKLPDRAMTRVQSFGSHNPISHAYRFVSIRQRDIDYFCVNQVFSVVKSVARTAGQVNLSD